MSAGAQQYCLRWNNHRSNLLTVFDELLQNEAFTDVTLACDGGASVKCHKMVLAACSTYFATLFTELPCRHPVVVLKDVKYAEIKAILEYMYRGEVNVAQDQLAALLKVAEALKVKGLVEENHREPPRHHHMDLEPEPQPQHSPPTISTSSPNIQSAAHSSSSAGSPPHSTAGPPAHHANGPYGKPPAAYGSNGGASPGSVYGKAAAAARLGVPLWAVPGVPLASAHHAPLLAGCFEAAAGGGAAPSADLSPLKRKKLSGLLLTRDTPILRTVLGQGHGHADSSQPVPLVCHPDSHDSLHSNGSPHDQDKTLRNNEPLEDAQSPYTDISLLDDEDKSKLAVASSSPLSFGGGDVRGVSSGIATYVPQQKPEWKRYKQYTRNDIMSAIEAVRNGMSALQAARKYGVPSRTLYDKVKKLGITTSRPFKRGANGSSACFPYGLSGTASPYSDDGGGAGPGGPAPHAALLEASFLQHALEEREALAAMAAAARSPSPGKYQREANGSGSGSGGSERGRDDDDDDDAGHAEDLSMGRKAPEPRSPPPSPPLPPPPPQQQRVIMPPMSQVAALLKKEEVLREIKVEDAE